MATDPLMRDVIIVGGGPAGLSAALLLGRCRRRVLVCDAGRPRNHASHELHGFLTRDGIEPANFLELGRDELCRYDTVEVRDIEVTDARRLPQGFEVTLADGVQVTGRKLLLATGVVDLLPTIDGIEAFYGRSVHHCPYCDGWEHRDEPLAAYGHSSGALWLARILLLWTRDVVLCTDGPAYFRQEDSDELAAHGIAVRDQPIARLEGRDGRLERIVFASGDNLPRRAMFFQTGQHTRSTLATRLGCMFTERGSVQTDEQEMTCVPGIYAAGDISRDVQLVIVAAAEGARAAFAINKALISEDLVLRS